MPSVPGPLRFADILTTASAVANYLGAATIGPGHLLSAVRILTGEQSMDDLGRPVSPLVRRAPPGAGPQVAPAVQALVQRWFAALGQDPNATFDEPTRHRFEADLNSLTATESGESDPRPPAPGPRPLTPDP